MLAEGQIVIILVMWLHSREYMWAVQYNIFPLINQEKAKPLPTRYWVAVVWWAGGLATLQGNVWRGGMGTDRSLAEEPSAAPQRNNMANWFGLR